MPDIILINPKSPNFLPNSRPPLGTLYLAAALIERGITVEIIDESVETDSRDRLNKYISDNPFCIGISTLSGNMLKGALTIAKYIRNINRNIPLIWGGVHPTLEPETTLKNDFVDFICVGEGEICLPEFVISLKTKQSYKNIDGLGYKEGGKIYINNVNKGFYNLDTLPSLPYHLIDLNKYKHLKSLNFFGFKEQLTLAIETTRGCSHRCTYCVQSLKNIKYHSMSSKSVLRHLEDILKLGIRCITIVDDNFFVDQNRSNEILLHIINKKFDIEIFVSVRSDYLSKIDDSRYILMKNAGIKTLSLGVESGSNRILELINKKEKISDTFIANRKLRKYKISAWFNFIVGFPNETLADITETYYAIIKILKENSFARISNKKLIPTPGTQIELDCIKLGMKKPETLAEYSEIDDQLWKKNDIYLDIKTAKWYKNTRYFQTLTEQISNINSPIINKRGLKFIFLYSLFYFFSFFILIRIKFQICSKFIDNILIYPYEKFFFFYLKIKWKIKSNA